ncbi:P-loop containing nucleoside triphosphate hydrolase protein [Ascobolus immersus RN42]|uniref:P-loop containing nucleoside triphosphate hydrolase protein n=1 Tax=Ascobolus immersus RN42 TaxID=1160509 RepID=A0A3N4IBC9_ASCIM|nr:P-loop containing nucleoside triphosphate hydrolase protein [Ascobolus immersus RN42]
MNNAVDDIAQHTLELYKDAEPKTRILIGIAGIPGSGKTTLAKRIANRINEILKESNDTDEEVAIMVPMDGYHYYRHELDQMEDPAFAHARRGSPFTFNSAKLLLLVQSLAAPISDDPIKAPSFDHALKDPIEDDIAILPTHRIVIMEGNYLSFAPPALGVIPTTASNVTYTASEPWKDIAQTFTERYFVECDKTMAERRLVGRHVKAGIVKDEEEGKKRVWMNDMPNGVDIETFRLGDEKLVVSVDDESLIGK